MAGPGRCRVTERPCRKHKVCLKHPGPCMIEGWTPPVTTGSTNCPDCRTWPTWIQGGAQGMAAHRNAIHAGDEPPPGSPGQPLVRRRKPRR